MNLLNPFQIMVAQITKEQVDIPDPDLADPSIKAILQIVFAIIGVIAIIIIILAGMKYNYALGDPQKTNEAKNAIIFAAIGLAVAVGAFSLVSLVVRSI